MLSVLLGFGGQDTWTGLTDFLYLQSTLQMSVIRTFRDDEDFRRAAAELSSEPQEAIVRSRIPVPILSKGYAHSEWRLKELAKKRTVFPIFYDLSAH